MINLNQLFNQDYLKSLSGTFQIEVSPDLAKAWLEFNTQNRVYSNSHALEYFKRMAAGQWCLNGQALIFSKNGKLLDGQHRLVAVVKYGAPVLFDVRFGIDEEVFASLDDGKKRTGSDVLSISNTPNYTKAAAAIKIIISIERKNTQQAFSSGNQPSNRHFLDWYNSHPGFDEYVRKGSAWSRISGGVLSPSKFTAYYYVAAQINQQDAHDFFEGLALGANLSPSGPVFKLRARLMKAKMDRTKSLNSAFERALIIKSWNLYRGGKTRKVLKFDRNTEAFPEFQ